MEINILSRLLNYPSTEARRLGVEKNQFVRELFDSGFLGYSNEIEFKAGQHKFFSSISETDLALIKLIQDRGCEIDVINSVDSDIYYPVNAILFDSYGRLKITTE